MKKLITILSVLGLMAFSSTKLTAQGCVANFTWTLHQNGIVTFTSTSAPTNSTTMYSWNFGNNTTYTNGGVNGQIASTTYSANGIYTVSLFINTIPTCSNSVTYTIAVNSAVNFGPCFLNANFNIVQVSNTLYNFLNASTGTVVGTTYTLNFGDGSTTANSMPVGHTYTANGTYVVTLIAANNATCTSTNTLSIQVNTICNVNASFLALSAFNGSVNFLSTSTGTTSNAIHIWNFGDGSNNVIGGPFASHTYVNGTYTAMLTVMNSSLNPTCSDTAFVSVAVTNATCNISPNFTYTVGANGAVNVTNTSTGANANTAYTWNFTNGFFSNAANPSTVTYPSSGLYYIMLTMSNGGACYSGITQSVNVTGIPCVANANFSLMPSTTPQLWIAIPSFPWNISAASWSWGDNSASTNTIYAAHQYANAGNYNICLTVTATCGATATACSTYSVYRGTAASAIISVNVTQPELKNLETASTVGLTELVANATAAIYPNPSNGLFNVSATGLLSDNATVTVYNTVGQVLHTSVRAVNNGTLNTEIALNTASNGIYFVKIEAGDKSVVNKLVISK